MKKDLSPQKAALQKLLALAEDRSFDVYETSGDIYGVRAWPVECLQPLSDLKHSKTKPLQQALNETLMNLTRGDFPKTLQKMQTERAVIHLTLTAGADPNYSDSYHGSLFDSFRFSQKAYGLLELVQDDRFESPNKLQDFYANHFWQPVHYFSPEEEQKVAMQDNAYRDDLIYTLFQKKMYPTHRQDFERLLPIVLKKDPQFFEKEQTRVIACLKRAKTPVQFWAALTQQQKEKE